MGKGRLLTYNTSSSYSAVIILHVTWGCQVSKAAQTSIIFIDYNNYYIITLWLLDACIP